MRTICKNTAIEFVTVALICLGILFSQMSIQAVASNTDVDMVRQPAVSGAFYPSSPDKLRKMVHNSLKSAKKEKQSQPIKILLAPHAGYFYCKNSLAAAYKSIDGFAFKYNTIILVGPSHRFPTKAGALSSADSWQTPLGQVQVDKTLSKQFAESSPRIEFDDRAHAQEHCLEVQLPYLIEASGGKPFKIVPILTNSSDPLDHRILGNALIKLANQPGTLIVISSDLSHYPPASIAEKVDRAILEAVKSMRPEHVTETNQKLMGAGYKGLSCTMCGLDAALSVLYATKGLGVNEARIASYTHSGMTGGTTEKVVGYGAMVFTRGSKPDITKDLNPMVMCFSEKSKEELLTLARDAAKKALLGEWVNYDSSNNPELQVKAGCFVTLKNKDQLRGCIGCFVSDEPLWKTVREMAVASATKDSRFFGNPIKSNEIPQLTIEISVLSPPELISDPLKEVKLGVHGIIVKDGTRSGTFLPQVATETKWSLEEFLGHCSRDKAGIGWGGWKKPSAKVYTYTATILSENH